LLHIPENYPVFTITKSSTSLQYLQQQPFPTFAVLFTSDKETIYLLIDLHTI
jgi:hypothetical protein